MLGKIFKRMLRGRWTALVIVLFSALLCAMLCYLDNVKMQEQKSFEDSYASVPVFFKITDLDGSRVTDPEGISGWMAELMDQSTLRHNLAPYVRELHVRMSYNDSATVSRRVWDPYRHRYVSEAVNVEMVGISSTRVAEELTAGYGGSICWLDGYDESIFATEEQVCIVPEKYKDESEVAVTFIYESRADWQYVSRRITENFKVAGYYSDPGNESYYCPYHTMERIYAKLGRPKRIEEIGAVLNDNSRIEELREDAARWFAEPNPLGEPTPWGDYGFEYYFYAMDIDDNMLRELEWDMKNSMLINRIASAMVFALSACAGFLTGFLVIRSRKKEIALMRTLGASQGAIFAELSLEQLICVAIGILLGGALFAWQPIELLLLFGAIYCVGLSLALLVFLRKNLLKTIKEED